MTLAGLKHKGGHYDGVLCSLLVDLAQSGVTPKQNTALTKTFVLAAW